MTAPTTGNLFLLYVDEEATQAVGAVPAWKLVGGQVSGDLGRKLGTTDTTTKDSDNWEEALPTNRAWDISLEHLIELGDEGFDLLMGMFTNREVRNVKFVYSNGEAWKGKAILTDFKLSAPQAQVAKASATLKGTAALTKL